MAEDTWFKMEREYFVDTHAKDLEIPPKKLSKAIETYNRFLQKALFGDSPFVAEDLRLTVLRSKGENVTGEQDREPGKSDSEN